MEGGERLTFRGSEGCVDLVEGEADVLIGPFVEGGEVSVVWEAGDSELVIVGCEWRSSRWGRKINIVVILC